ncbi:acyl carrier protein [Niveibacterium umoris]|uniref:Acyl carrier protein n=1 Tax=Niveibacterium umoris TaxID=1193620 RepID=A0A840BGM3_9RHOO|nr:acyl carrier protein [Niveibacterium umoris]MBB4012315.1 acyl carrier protein [Niveibacterium umoris]
MNTRTELAAILDELLSLGGRAAGFDDATALLGAIPELDSMAVVGVIGAIEERFGIVFDDDEIDGAAFASFGRLVSLIESKIG